MKLSKEAADFIKWFKLDRCYRPPAIDSGNFEPDEYGD